MDRVIVPELNVTGQFARLARADVGLECESVTKATGLPFTAAQIADYITEGAAPDRRQRRVAARHDGGGQSWLTS